MFALLSVRAVADPGLFEQVESALERAWASCGQVSDAVRLQVGTAAAEILANIVEHGRRDGRPVNVEVEISVGGGRLQIGLTDDGDEPDVDINGAAMPAGQPLPRHSVTLTD